MWQWYRLARVILQTYFQMQDRMNAAIRQTHYGVGRRVRAQSSFSQQTVKRFSCRAHLHIATFCDTNPAKVNRVIMIKDRVKALKERGGVGCCRKIINDEVADAAGHDAGILKCFIAPTPQRFADVNDFYMYLKVLFVCCETSMKKS